MEALVKNRFILIISISLPILFSACRNYKNMYLGVDITSVRHKTEKLDLAALYGHSISTSTFETSIFTQNADTGKDVYYEHTDLITNIKIMIGGNTAYGFTETVLYPENTTHKILHIEFYPNGVLSKKEFQYKYFTSGNPVEDGTYPIGITYGYNIEGETIYITNNEKYFKFSLEKVKNQLKTMGIAVNYWGNNLGSISRNVKNGKGYWNISIYYPSITLIEMDGNTGTIISRRTQPRIAF